MKPLVSIVIPVYNAENYLEECLDSLYNQTYNNYEVICVDDGSTDNSFTLIKKYENKDSRFKVFSQKNQFAGVARNNGMKYAKGKYLLFLDADDFFDKDLLKETVNIAEQYSSDIVVYGANYYDEQSKIVKNAPWILNLSHVPQKKSFSKYDIPKYILNFTSSCAWNKLFRTDFIKNNDIKFQTIERGEDVYFTNIALLKAERISTYDKALVNYRTNNPKSLQGGVGKNPNYFLEALISIKERMECENLYIDYRKSFINFALSHCLHNLNLQRDFKSYSKLYNDLKYLIFEELEIIDLKEDDIYEKEKYRQYKYIDRFSIEEYLFDEKMNLCNNKNNFNIKNKYRICIPYHLNKVKIVLFAAGFIGQDLYKQINEKENLELVLWVDAQFEKYQERDMNVLNPQKIKEVDFDYVIIAIENQDSLNEIARFLHSIHVDKKKILRLL